MSLDPFGAQLDDIAVHYRTSWRLTRHGTVSRETGGIALDGATCEFPAGAFTGLLGRNGAGKTSMLSLLAGFRRPTAGTVRVGHSGCPSLSRSSASRRWPSSTSSPRASTRQRAARPGTSWSASGTPGSLSCWSPTSWTRPSGSATGSS